MSAPNRPFQPRANASGALSPTLSSSGAVSPPPYDDGGVFDGAAAASAEAAAAASAAPKPAQQQRTETVSIAPYGSPTSSSSSVHAVPLSMAMNSSSRVPSASSNHSSTLLQQQSSPTMRHQSSPTSGLAGQTGSDRAPLLREFNLADSADDPNSTDLKAHSIAAPAASSAASATAAASTTSVYDQYESTVAKIRARRAAEAASKATVARPTPERQKHELKVVSIFLSVVTLIVALVVYFMYPRIPLWSIDRVRIEQLKLWSDGSASFQIHTGVSVNNANFMMTGIESIAISVGHNGTTLGAPTVMEGPLKFRARQNNPLDMDHNFSPVPPEVFRDLFAELSSTAGELTLDYSIAIVTSENFRLRNIQVECQCKMQVDPTPVPPVAQILLTQCSHTERTG